jgi:hypothetical protein
LHILTANAEYIKMINPYVPGPGGTSNNNFANLELILDIAKRMQVCTRAISPRLKRKAISYKKSLSPFSGLYTYCLLTWRLIRYKAAGYGLDGVTHRKIPSWQNY